MDHFWFITLSYAATVLVFAGVVTWLLIDHQSLVRRLRDLDARGIRRRSQAGSGKVTGR